MANVGGEREDVSATDPSQKRVESDTRELDGGSDTGTNQWYVAKTREVEDSSMGMAAGPKPRGFCLGPEPAAAATPAQDVVDSSKDMENGTKPRDSSDATAGEDGDLRILRMISQRLENSALACVLPSDYTKREGEIIAAQHYQDLELQTDFAELASFLGDAKAKFFGDLPLDGDGTPIKIKEARFMFENYNPLCRAFYLQKSLEQRALAHRMEGGRFLPVIAAGSLMDEEKRTFATKLCPTVRLGHLPFIDKLFWNKFDQVIELVGKNDMAVNFEKFMDQSYFALVAEGVQAHLRQPSPGEATYPISTGGANSRVQAERKELISKASVEDFKKVQDRLGERWQQNIEQMELDFGELALDRDSEEMFKKASYYAVLAQVLQERKRTATVDPAVGPEVNCSGEVEMAKRRKMLALLTEAQADEIALAVSANWEKAKLELTPLMQVCVPVKPSQSYWERHYYTVMEQIVAKGSREQGAPSRTMEAQTSPPKTKPTEGMEALLDGTTHEAEMCVDEETAWISAASLLEDNLTGTSWKYEGWLLECDAQLRSVTFKSTTNSPAKRGPPDSEIDVAGPTLCALDVLLGDKSGPVICCLWGETAQTVLNHRRTMKPNAPKLLISLERVRVVTLGASLYNGKILTPMKAIHSVKAIGVQSGTILTFPGKAASPYTTTTIYKAPTAPKILVVFQAEKGLQTAPFRVTMKGMVDNVEPADATTKGEAKVAFDLIDSEGSAVRFVALGRNAANPNLVSGKEVIAYHGSGRGPCGSQPGCVYLFKDAMIVPAGDRFPRTSTFRSISIGRS